MKFRNTIIRSLRLALRPGRWGTPETAACHAHLWSHVPAEQSRQAHPCTPSCTASTHPNATSLPCGDPEFVAAQLHSFFSHALFRPVAVRPRKPATPPPEMAAEKGERNARADVATSRAKAEGWTRTGQPKEGHRRGRARLPQPAPRGEANALRAEWKRGRAARRR